MSSVTDVSDGVSVSADANAYAPAPGDDRAARRGARLLLRRSRAVWVSIVLGSGAVVAALIGTEIVLAASSRPPLLVSPQAMIDAVLGGGPVSVVIAVVAALAGIVCLWGALAPGRTHRRLVRGRTAPVVVDDDLIAGSFSRRAAQVAGVAPAQARTDVARRRADVRVAPATGFAVDTDEVAAAVRADAAELRLEPALTVRAGVDESGRLS